MTAFLSKLLFCGRKSHTRFHRVSYGSCFVLLLLGFGYCRVLYLLRFVIVMFWYPWGLVTVMTNILNETVMTSFWSKLPFWLITSYPFPMRFVPVGFRFVTAKFSLSLCFVPVVFRYCCDHHFQMVMTAFYSTLPFWSKTSYLFPLRFVPVVFYFVTPGFWLLFCFVPVVFRYCCVSYL